MNFDKECIIYENKICDNCGDCNFCDINPDKVCDNCGICLEGYDYTGIQIDDLLVDKLDSQKSYNEYSKDDWKFLKEYDNDTDSEVIFIDDIENPNDNLQNNHQPHKDKNHNHDCCHEDY
jgi:hypothetical protein